MSKSEKKEKVVVNFADVPELEDLGLPELIKEYEAALAKEKFHADKVAFYESRRNTVKVSLQTVIETAEADSVVYTTPDGDDWKSTLVTPEATPVLSEALLKANMMKIGKIPAPVVDTIITKSTVPGKAKKSYVLVTKEKKSNE